MDRGGVSELPADVMADYQDQLQTDVNTILRYHLKDPTSAVSLHAGPDVVDVTQVDWVEVIDRQGHTIRIAIGRLKHLPVRVLVRMRDPETGGPLERSTFYASYHLASGIEVPYQVSRFRNDKQISQVFFENCQFNAALPEESIHPRFAGRALRRGTRQEQQERQKIASRSAPAPGARYNGQMATAEIPRTDARHNGSVRASRQSRGHRR